MKPTIEQEKSQTNTSKLQHIVEPSSHSPIIETDTWLISRIAAGTSTAGELKFDGSSLSFATTDGVVEFSYRTDEIKSISFVPEWTMINSVAGKSHELMLR